jgi:dephospho-CoA kinase
MKLKSRFSLLIPQQRLHQLQVPLIGLTGGIASGKSTVASLLSHYGLPIINADLLVKSIYARPETFSFIQNEFPDVIHEGVIKFPLLREKVFLNEKIKNQIENYIYQRLPQAFLHAYQDLQTPSLVVYDVPLLFEKKMEHLFDLKVLVYAPRTVQMQRLQNRDKISPEMANNILNQQMDIEEKRLKADFIIDNSKTETDLVKEVETFLNQVLDR